MMMIMISHCFGRFTILNKLKQLQICLWTQQEYSGISANNIQEWRIWLESSCPICQPPSWWRAISGQIPALLGGVRFSVPQTWLKIQIPRSTAGRNPQQQTAQPTSTAQPVPNTGADGHAERRSPGLVDQWRRPAVRPPRLSGCPSQTPWFCGTLQDGVGRWGEFQSGWVSHEQLGCSGNQIGILMGMYTFFSNAKLPSK